MYDNIFNLYLFRLKIKTPYKFLSNKIQSCPKTKSNSIRNQNWGKNIITNIKAIEEHKRKKQLTTAEGIKVTTLFSRKMEKNRPLLGVIFHLVVLIFRLENVIFTFLR